MKQLTLAMAVDQCAGFGAQRKPTRREAFLDEMNTIVPWAQLCAVVEPFYPKRGNGRPPIALERMLRIHFVQHWFNLADLACEEALYDSLSLRRFVGIYLGSETVPDATTLLKFRHLLEEHKLGERIFAEVGAVLQARGAKLKSGTIVDATLIGAPSSTKNKEKARDPEMHQTRKGQQWHFDMKLHIGVDSQSGLAHSAVVTAANVHDKHPLPQLLHGEEQRVYGDSAYASQKALIHSKAPTARDFTNKRTRRKDVVDEVARRKNRNKSKIRARVEHVFAGREAAVGLHEGSLSRAGEKRQSRLRCARAGQSLHVARGTGAPVEGQRRAKSPCRAPQGAQHEQECALLRLLFAVSKVYTCLGRSPLCLHGLISAAISNPLHLRRLIAASSLTRHNPSYYPDLSSTYLCTNAHLIAFTCQFRDDSRRAARRRAHGSRQSARPA
ncbi:IS5 family transposase [Paraburkholderia atlantica]